MSPLVSILCAVGSLLGAASAVHTLVQLTRRLRMQQTQLATSTEWPPPYAANKGVKQDLAIEGFAYTYGNGCAFVHMKPVLHFGVGSERKALYELRSRIELAHSRVCARLGTIGQLLGASVADEAREAALQFHDQLADIGAPPATHQRAMAVLRDTIREKAATEGEKMCSKYDEASGMPCIDDDGHEGACTFPRIESGVSQ